MSDKKPNTFERNDDFWDIERMLPKKRIMAVFSEDTDASEIEVGNRPSKEEGQKIPPLIDKVSEQLKKARSALNDAENKFRKYSAYSYDDRSAINSASREIKTAKQVIDDTFEPYQLRDKARFTGTDRNEGSVNDDPADELLYTYAPKDGSLIKEVTVKLWPARYSFYEQFRKDAKRFYNVEGAPCPSVPFFSFTPQYSQLSSEQLSFYLYFRQCVRDGNPISADYSYVLLLIYETINLPDILPPQQGLALLCSIWRSYRNVHPKLDRHLSEWVCDYCLIHELEPKMIRGLDTAYASRYCSLKEFYSGLDDTSGSPYAAALFSYSSGYDYRSSKFITEENRHIFDKHIRGAFIYAFTKVEREGQTIFAPIGEGSMTTLKMVRDAYSGALCAYNVKRRIEVTYLSCSRSVELRYAVTDTIKFAENQVRAMLGIRSRFHTPNLAPPLKNAVEEYFAPYKKSAKRDAEKQSAPEYDALYEPTVSELSPELAKDLEQRSWATTELLTDGLSEYAENADSICSKSICAPAPTDKHIDSNAAVTAPERSALGNDDLIKRALLLCVNGDNAGFASLASEKGLLTDALVEAVNDKMYDIIGDIVIENVGGEYRPITDYLEEIKEWMKQ